ncbi:hypothetical protein PV327_000176 [Microctonus hyperodae]|uniref:Uncharacterized protein n=1 Tax=Microctonus hyperodae TaxID=165561 RepID=A0AA39G642_MICHY|nr:hypothetical protein PV327_000176 [Microctonus hyperodae]
MFCYFRYRRKLSVAAQNEDAASSSPAAVLAKWPETCLLVACWLGRHELVKALIERGTNIFVRENDGRFENAISFIFIRPHLNLNNQKLISLIFQNSITFGGVCQ